MTDVPITETTTAPCPIGQLEGDQIALICPTGLRRHPKYCNLFYQCVYTDEIKVELFTCPTGNIFDNDKIGCVKPNETSQPCTGQISEKSLFRSFSEINSLKRVSRLNNQMKSKYLRIQLLLISFQHRVSDKPLCPAEGQYELNNPDCDKSYVRCGRTIYNRLEGHVINCPDGYAFWSKTGQCENVNILSNCNKNDAVRSITV